jgi:hypothetical protein
VAAAVVLIASSFVDNGLVPDDFPVTLVAMTAVFFMATLRERTQAVAGLAIGIGATAVVAHNDPQGASATSCS